MARPRSPSDLTDVEWPILELLIPARRPGGRSSRHPRREIVNAILYVLRSGCQWRALPPDLSPRGAVWW
ncbi:MAG TPA: transposase [Thermomicrobiales bacterium]|jgi:transposase|nr:transposase [Thermomicrobiales bacterium]